MRDRRTERHEATRAEILDAAWELCRAEGLAGLSLRELAKRVGMRAPSLYSYFDSKHAIYDAMFAQGCQEYLDRVGSLVRSGDTTADLQAHLRLYVEFCTEDTVRHQLLFQRTIPGFEPSPESFALSVEGLETLVRWFEEAGLGGREHLDLATAIGSGLAAQQNANDPGGDRWLRLVDEAVEMFVGHVRGSTSKRKSTPNDKGRKR